MKKIPTSLPEVYILEPNLFKDDRGFFMESYNEEIMSSLGLERKWVQDNHSNSQGGVLRGLHYQVVRPQAKLVRVIKGGVIDVVVDIREGSPNFGKHISVELTGGNNKMLFVPEGFAHGFYTTEDDTHFVYKCSDYYAPEYERCIIWNDPSLNINWGNTSSRPNVSDKDKDGVLLEEADLPPYEVITRGG